jgi:hypothetical protein
VTQTRWGSPPPPSPPPWRLAPCQRRRILPVPANPLPGTRSGTPSVSIRRQILGGNGVWAAPLCRNAQTSLHPVRRPPSSGKSGTNLSALSLYFPSLFQSVLNFHVFTLSMFRQYLDQQSAASFSYEIFLIHLSIFVES